MKVRYNLIAILMYCCLIPCVKLLAQADQSLMVGDSAPDLKGVSTWLKGNPVVDFKTDDPLIYVLNFTGTWCPPCIKKLPHLADLQNQYVGKIKLVNIFVENSDDEDSNIKRVRKLMDGLGDRMGENIVVDMPRKRRTTWGNPQLAMFIVKGGRIIYRGGPSELDPLLEQIVAGTFDEAIAQREQEAYRTRFSAALQAQKEGDFQIALNGINRLIEEAHAGNIAHLVFTKYNILVESDCYAAYRFLEWIISSRLNGVDWPHLIGSGFYKIPKEHRNYRIELAAMDRAIEESETVGRSAYPIMQKAGIYEKIGDYWKALETMEQCVEISRVEGGNEEYEQMLACLKYKVRVRQNVHEANEWLRAEMKKPIASKYLHRWIDAVRDAPTSDNNLALELIEKALADQSLDNHTAAALLRRKMSVLAAMEAFEKAADIGFQVAEMYEKLSKSQPFNESSYKLQAEKTKRLAQGYEYASNF